MKTIAATVNTDMRASSRGLDSLMLSGAPVAERAGQA
jgi:hypothetical protein